MYVCIYIIYIYSCVHVYAVNVHRMIQSLACLPVYSKLKNCGPKLLPKLGDWLLL